MKKKLAAAIITVAAIVGLAGCSCPFNSSSDSTATKAVSASASTTEAKAVYHKISQTDAKARMEKNPQVIILDVRTPQEFQEGHIKNAKLLPNENITTTTPPKELPDKNAEILVYCRSGNRSKQASDKLVALGYTKVYDFGGINTWTYGVEK